jgi:hypothetical protein
MMQHEIQAFEVSGFRLDMIRQLLGDLDTVTASGRSFTMGKVVGLLRDEVVAIGPALSEPQERVIKTALDELTREKGRLLPDSDWFVARTQMITDTLALM